jgi:hypothetical protein
MNTQEYNADIQTDDEAIRVQAMTSGEVTCGRFRLRPTCATEISWMQRNGIMEPNMDIIWRVSAFAFVHSEPKPEVRAIVNSKDDFSHSVDSWMDRHNPDAEEIKQLSTVMNERISEWFSSASDTDTPASLGN